MKSIIYHEFGDVDVLKYEEVDDPIPGEDEVVVNVKAVALNALDLRLRSGKSPRPVDLPHIGGIDISGDIAKIGSLVEGVEENQRVIIDPTVKLEKGFKVVGVNFWGGLSEFVKLPASNVIAIPDELSYNDASTIPICYTTAIYGLVDRGNLKEGETAIVHAAGSGTGSAAVQIAKAYGAKVIATAGSDSKLEKAKELGADHVINYNEADFSEEVKNITNGKGVNLIFDQIGASIWDKNIQSLSGKGRLLLVGVVGGGAIETSVGPIIMKDLSVLGVTVFNSPRKNIETAVALMASGKIKSVIDNVLPLSEAANAQKLLEDRQQFGKVVLNP